MHVLEASPSPAPDGDRRVGRLWIGGWIVALLLRALWLTLVHNPGMSVWSDMGGYYDRAREMYEAARWSPYAFFQGAGYPALLGLVRKLWASDPDLGMLVGWVQIALGLVALAGMVRLARHTAGAVGAGAALALGAVHVPWMYFASAYMPEMAYAAVLAGLGLALLRIARAPDATWGSALLVGLAGAAAAWLKSFHLFVGPIAAVVWLFPLRRGWRGAARITVGWFAALALFFWIPHGSLSWAKSGMFLPSPPAAGMNLVMGKCSWKHLGDSNGFHYWPPLFVQLGREDRRVFPAPFVDQSYYTARALECIRERPVVLLESLEGIPYLFVGNRLWPASFCGPRSALLNDAWARVFSWPLLAAMVLAVAFAVARGARPRAHPGAAVAEVWLALLAPLLSLCATVWVFFSEVRYRVPFDVFVFPLALWGCREAVTSLVMLRRAALAREVARAVLAGAAAPDPTWPPEAVTVTPLPPPAADAPPEVAETCPSG